MKMTDDWPMSDDDVNNRIKLIEENILRQPFKDKKLLIKALLRRAKINELPKSHEFRKIGSQGGLKTIGDAVLNFVIGDRMKSAEGKKYGFYQIPFLQIVSKPLLGHCILIAMQRSRRWIKSGELRTFLFVLTFFMIEPS